MHKCKNMLCKNIFRYNIVMVLVLLAASGCEPSDDQKVMEDTGQTSAAYSDPQDEDSQIPSDVASDVISHDNPSTAATLTENSDNTKKESEESQNIDTATADSHNNERLTEDTINNLEDTDTSDAASLIAEAMVTSTGRAISGSAAMVRTYPNRNQKHSIVISQFELDADNSLSMRTSGPIKIGRVSWPAGNDYEIRHVEGTAYVKVPKVEASNRGIHVGEVAGDSVWLTVSTDTLADMGQSYPLMLLCSVLREEQTNGLACDPLEAVSIIAGAAQDAVVVDTDTVGNVPTTRVRFTVPMLVMAAMSGKLAGQALDLSLNDAGVATGLTDILGLTMGSLLGLGTGGTGLDGLGSLLGLGLGLGNTDKQNNTEPDGLDGLLGLDGLDGLNGLLGLNGLSGLLGLDGLGLGDTDKQNSTELDGLFGLNGLLGLDGLNGLLGLDGSAEPYDSVELDGLSGLMPDNSGLETDSTSGQNTTDDTTNTTDDTGSQNTTDDIGDSSLGLLFGMVEGILEASNDAEIWIDRHKLIRRFTLDFTSIFGVFADKASGDMSRGRLVINFHEFDADDRIYAPASELVVGDLSLLNP